MYPVSLGYAEAVKRINALLKNGHNAEALLTSVFTVEKTLHRTLKQLIVSAGFPSKQAEALISQFKGMEKAKQVWPCFDPRHEALSTFVAPPTLKTIAEAQTMRNKLVHGTAVFSQAVCEATARAVLVALDDLKKSLDVRYGFNGWTKVSVRRTSRLHADAKVTV